MNTSVEKLEGNRVRITMSSTAEEVDAAVAGAYARVARQVKIQGFRPGKAPRAVVDTHVGRDNVLGEALQDVIDKSFVAAVEEHDLRTMGRPDTGELDLLEEGKDYTFTAEVDLRPELELASVEGLTASMEATKASEADIDAEVEYLRDRFATLESVEGRGVQAGDFALLSFSGTVDGRPADDLVVDKYLYELGQGIMPAEFDEALIGAMPGDVRHAEFAVPDTAANPDYVGKTAVFAVEVFEIKSKSLPALDDEFAANVGGFDTVEDLRLDISRKFIERRLEALPRLMERAAFDALSERLEGEVPEEMINNRARTSTDEFYEDLAERKIKPEDYFERTGRSVDDVFVEMQQQARIRVTDELALEALYRQAGLKFTEEDVDKEIEGIAADDKTTVAKMRKRLLDRGVMPLIRERLIQRTAAKWLMDNIKFEQPADEAAAQDEKSEPKKKAPAKKKAAAPAKKKAADAGKKPADEPQDPADE